MSEVKVNKISPRSGTTVTLGDSGDTITLASGVSLTGVNATFSGDLTVDTNTLYVDSTNNRVGIGTTSPSSTLSVQTSAGTFNVEPLGAGSVQLASPTSLGFNVGSGYSYEFDVNGSEAMRIDSSGNVGIGTSSPTFPSGTGLAIHDASVSRFKLTTNTSGETSTDGFEVTASGSDAFINNRENGNLILYTNSTERMRIDSSGNVLVGKTSTDLGTAGTALLPSGVSFFTRDGDKVLRVNRLTSDGDIIDLLKNGTTIGTLGVKSGDNFVIINPHTNTSKGIGIADDNLYPTSGDGNSSNNAMDIGDASAKFRHLYLGGSVYLGGTGSANALDDYEEGTWTPNFTYTTTTPSFSYVTRTGRYTKIGRMVMIQFSLNVTSINTAGASGEIEITGLPFTCKSTSASAGAVMVYGADVYANAYDVTINVQDNSSNFRFIQSRDNEGWINMSTANDAGQLIFQSSFVYDTDS